ncbi:hypothetical protein J6590_026118, partial [Homalodisca vitripennis]
MWSLGIYIILIRNKPEVDASLGLAFSSLALAFTRIYVKKCLGCSERIGPDELVMRALDSVFHLRCFVCVVCGVRLQKGDQFVIKQGQLFCRPDYEKEVEMLQGYSQAMGEYPCDELVATARSHDGRRGPKRPRTILTTQQRRAFKASFEVSPKPCRKVREGLAKDTGLSVRIVQVMCPPTADRHLSPVTGNTVPASSDDHINRKGLNPSSSRRSRSKDQYYTFWPVHKGPSRLQDALPNHHNPPSDGISPT